MAKCNLTGIGGERVNRQNVLIVIVTACSRTIPTVSQQTQCQHQSLIHTQVELGPPVAHVAFLLNWPCFSYKLVNCRLCVFVCYAVVTAAHRDL